MFLRKESLFVEKSTNSADVTEKVQEISEAQEDIDKAEQDLSSGELIAWLKYEWKLLIIKKLNKAAFPFLDKARKGFVLVVDVCWGIALKIWIKTNLINF